MAGDNNLLMLGLGGIFVAACITIGTLIGSDKTEPVAPPVAQDGRLKAADLEVSTSQISRDDRSRAAEACTGMMMRKRKSALAYRQGPPEEALPDFCACIAHGGARELSRLQFLILEASFRATGDASAGFGSVFANQDGRARSAEINGIARQATRLGMSQGEVNAEVERADRTLNRIVRDCASELPQPKSSWSSSSSTSRRSR